MQIGHNIHFHFNFGTAKQMSLGAAIIIAVAMAIKSYFGASAAPVAPQVVNQPETHLYINGHRVQ